MEPQQHWETVYRTKGDHEVSWFEGLPEVSLRLLDAAGVRPESCVLDVGGGDSRLVDVAVQRLRAKVEDDPKEPKLIVTVRGVGYRFERT